MKNGSEYTEATQGKDDCEIPGTKFNTHNYMGSRQDTDKLDSDLTLLT